MRGSTQSAQAAASPLCAVPHRAHRPQRVRCARFHTERTGRCESVVRGSYADHSGAWTSRTPKDTLGSVPDRIKRLPARFYRAANGREPVREWLNGLELADRRLISEEIISTYGRGLAVRPLPSPSMRHDTIAPHLQFSPPGFRLIWTPAPKTEIITSAQIHP